MPSFPIIYTPIHFIHTHSFNHLCINIMVFLLYTTFIPPFPPPTSIFHHNPHPNLNVSKQCPSVYAITSVFVIFTPQCHQYVNDHQINNHPQNMSLIKNLIKLEYRIIEEKKGKKKKKKKKKKRV
ncbi:hypothetical protein DID88_007283 [Monilinia fructigena]|uniref:Uncharacterized protein n=1 Tax=Monilinia fructigena TaxID=38457 RepID=A0A395J8V1_9HELO|nr:hypothetical protein DID88_007283 [Monilinia fructigena]